MSNCYKNIIKHFAQALNEQQMNNKDNDNTKAVEHLIKSIGYDGFAALIELHAAQNNSHPGEFIQGLSPYSWKRYASLKDLRDAVDAHLDTKDLDDEQFIEEFKKATNNGLLFIDKEVVAFNDL